MSIAYGIYPKLPSEAFVAKFTKKFGHAPKVYADFGYDAAMFLIRARKAKVAFGAPTASFEYEGVTAHHKISASSRALSKGAAVIVTTRNGKVEVDG